MKNAIIVHGRPSKEVYYSSTKVASSNFAWIPWLQKQLLIRDIKADTPEMPAAYEPEYEIWKKELERFDIGPDTVLVGHSAGGGFLLRWLTENADVRIEGLVLVAPSIDPERKSQNGFSDFELEPNVQDRIGRFDVLVSDNDFEGVVKSVEMISSAFSKVNLRVFEGYGHFIPTHMGTSEFPELVEIVLGEG